MEHMDYPENDLLLAARIKALAHPARLAIVRALIAREACCCGEIVSVLPLAQSTVSQHLKILRKAGLIKGEVSGPRSCYCLDREALASVAAEMERLGLPIVPAPAESRAEQRDEAVA
jgi:ArsR family transcriptional regulator